MQQKPNGVIDPLVVTEGMVATFMCYDPNTTYDRGLKEPVNRPCETGEVAGEEVDVTRGRIKGN